MQISIACKTYDSYISFSSSSIINVILFIVSHFSHFVPKSVIFQNACGVRKIGSPHFLHVYMPIKGVFR